MKKRSPSTPSRNQNNLSAAELARISGGAVNRRTNAGDDENPHQNPDTGEGGGIGQPVVDFLKDYVEYNIIDTIDEGWL